MQNLKGKVCGTLSAVLIFSLFSGFKLNSPTPQKSNSFPNSSQSQSLDQKSVTRKPIMSFEVIADNHLEIKEKYNRTNTDILKQVLQDIKTSDPNSSAVAIIGDFTQEGRAKEAKAFFKILEENSDIAQNHFLISLGNHDARGLEPQWLNGSNWDTIRPLYMQYNAQYRDKNSTTYFSKKINGYPFIVLNTEKALKDQTYLSKKQLNWLDSKLKEYSNSEKPVFVFNHQALNDTHKNSDEYGGFGDQSEAVENILKKYPNVFFFSAHIHNSFDVTTILEREYGTLVDVPSIVDRSYGNEPIGCGYQVNVYKDKIEFKARNFKTSKWLPQYDIIVPIKTMPTLYSECKNKNKNEYTAESWKAVEAAMKKAENVFSLRYEPNIGVDFKPIYTAETRKKINKEIIPELQSALNGLVPKSTVS